MRRLILAALLAAGLCHPALAAWPSRGHYAGVSASQSALATTVAGMAPDSFKLISTGTDGGIAANGLAPTCANFDGSDQVGGTPCSATGTWTTDAAVGGSPSGSPPGVGAVGASRNFAFSGAGIATDGSKICMTGGGHADGGDGSFYCFDVQAAAAAVNGGSRTGAWQLVVAGAKYIDAFTHSEPAGSPEIHGTSPTGQNQSYWAGNGPNGVQMWSATHSYFYIKNVPGTHLWNISGEPGFIQVSNHIGATWYVNSDNGSVIGPLKTSVSIPFNTVGNNDGLVQETSGNPTAVCWNDKDGQAYTWTIGGGGMELYTWQNPTTSSLALVDTGAGTGSTSGQVGSDCVVFPDPNNANQRAWFFYHNNGSGEFVDVVTGLNGGTPTWHGPTAFSGGVPANCAWTTPGLTYNGATGKIAAWGGVGHICAITPNTDPSLYTISEITVAPTGDIPAGTGGNGGSNIPVIQFIGTDNTGSTVNAFILEDSGNVWLYKPPT